MKAACLFLITVCLLASCSSGANVEAEKNAALRARAQVAEANLQKIRDAVLAYYKKNAKKPDNMNDLADFGAAEGDLLVNDDYSELAYAFYNVEFEDGKMTRGWFIATPISNTGALMVRLNGVSGNFDYTPQGEEFGPAPDDEGWGNTPANTPVSNG